MMNYLSLCSGIEAATVAWEPLGWKAVAFSEIDAFPSAVLTHHYPDVPNLGDMTKYKEWDIEPGTVDVIIGGTPCQSFSIAGLRKGLDDPRGNLMLTYLAIADALRPKWLVWENVPGVLSIHNGRDFGTFLGGLGQLGYGFAYRVLDAQYFGVPQRRRRVFVVGCLGDWRLAAAVLFERESLRRNPPPSRKAGEKAAGTITGGFGERGVDADQVANGNYAIADHIQSRYHKGANSDTLNCLVAHTLNAHPNRIDGESETFIPVTYDIHTNDGGSVKRKDRPNGGFYVNQVDKSLTIGSPSKTLVVDQVQWSSGGGKVENDTAQALRSNADHNYQFARVGRAVRRLTPIECERLQGFPDNYTQIPWRGKPAEYCPDGPRYKALGNSFAVPVVRWIGERIAMVDTLMQMIEKEG